MTRLMYGIDGDRVRTASNVYTRRAREEILNGDLPAWLEVSVGTPTATELGAGSDWFTDRGALSIATAATANARATLRTTQLVSWQAFTAIIWTIRGLATVPDDANSSTEMGMVSDDNNYGLFLVNNTMKLVNAGATINVATNAVLKNRGLQSMSVALFPRSDEWAVFRDLEPVAYGINSPWDWSTVRKLRPYVSVQAVNAAAKVLRVTDAELTLECW